MTKKRVIFFSILLALVFLFYLISSTGYRDIIENSDLLKLKIEALGNWSPVIIIFSIAIAIVMIPIPSAPIALAAGALYGHLWGAIYVLIGSSLGAITAFLIARVLGIEFLHRWINSDRFEKWIGSLN